MVALGEGQNGRKCRPRAEKLARGKVGMGNLCGHVGDGNFHSMLLFDPDNEEEYSRCKMVANRMAELAISLGGE